MNFFEETPIWAVIETILFNISIVIGIAGGICGMAALAIMLLKIRG